MRDVGRFLKIHYITVARKKRFLAWVADELHRRFLVRYKEKPLQYVQFDEMWTFEHTKCKPISILVVIEPKDRKIISLSIAPFRPTTKRLAAISFKKYGYRPDLRSKVLDETLSELKSIILPTALFRTDECPRYSSKIMKHFQKSQHERFKGRRAIIAGQGELKEGGFDPLFSLNHTCAMIRAHVNRLMRRTWCTTKRIEGLKEHLSIYQHFHNTVLT